MIFILIMSNQRWMMGVGQSVRTLMIQVAVSSFVHYDQQGACDNFVFLGQIQGADEIWAETFTVAISWDK